MKNKPKPFHSSVSGIGGGSVSSGSGNGSGKTEEEEAVAAGPLYGIRSYLHNFYSSAEPDDDQEDDEQMAGRSVRGSRRVKTKNRRPNPTFGRNGEDEEDDDEEDEEEDEEDNAPSRLPAGYRNLRRHGRRELRRAMQRSREYVRIFQEKLESAPPESKRSWRWRCSRCVWQTMMCIGVVSLILSLVGLIVAYTVAGKQFNFFFCFSFLTYESWDIDTKKSVIHI